MSDNVTLGYVPLSDALPLFAAERLQLFALHGLAVSLQPMPSWARLRDALVIGEVDAAHCLAGIPLAAQAGLYGPHADLACALTLNHHGNAITLYRPLAEQLSGEAGMQASLRRKALAERDGLRPLTFASVFPVSKHEFELRHWLRQLDVDPDHDVKLLVIPPPLVARALRERQIDGFCVGEPWNSLALHQGIGQVVASSRSLGLPGTEKVLATRSAWLEHPKHLALIRALDEACHWLDQPANRPKALAWLAEALDLDPEHLRPGLLGSPDSLPDGESSHFVRFSGINRPDNWHARWLLGQMEHNLSMPAFRDAGAICRRAFRADIYEIATAAATS